MPKQKTNSGAKKRFKLTKSGKVMRFNANKRHLLVSKSAKRKRHLRKASIEPEMMAKKVRQMLPYGN
jgi:large subunit ribosomal protein L35